MTDRRPGLDLLRACAICGVVLAHGLAFLYPHFWYLGYFGHLGSYGVDLFFVLSGFLIGGILRRHGEQLRLPRVLVGFWLRRWLRTLPNYALFLVVNIAATVLIFHRAMNWRGEVLPSAIFTQSLAWPPGTFFPESWTLAVEEWFYLTFPLALALGFAVAGRWRRWVWPVLLGAMFVGPMLLRLRLADGTDWATNVRMPMIHRLDSIAFGVAAAVVAAKYPGWWRAWRLPAAVVGVALLVPCYVQLFLVDLNHSWFLRTFWFDAVSLGFALLLPWADGAVRVPAEQAVRSVALWSYSMYLTNFLLLTVGMQLIGEATRTSLVGALATFVIYWVLCIGLSAAVYHWFERPILLSRERIKMAREAEPRIPA